MTNETIRNDLRLSTLLGALSIIIGPFGFVPGLIILKRTKTSLLDNDNSKLASIAQWINWITAAIFTIHIIILGVILSAHS